MKVLDWRQNEIKVGSKAIYGSPDPGEAEDHTVEVVAISDPDVLYNPVTDADDGGYAVFVTVRFKNGETDRLQANIASSCVREAAWACGEPVEEVFEEGGDLEVIL